MSNELNRKLVVAVMILGCHATAGAASAFDPLATRDRYNVVWNSPSQNAHGSMPSGNGDVGINAWVEASGDLVVFVSKTDSWNMGQRKNYPGQSACLLARPRTASGRNSPGHPRNSPERSTTASETI